MPPLNDPGVAQFFGMSGAHLLMIGLLVCILGMIFGLVVFTQLRDSPVHPSMREISELIYETCKTYLVQQLKFVGILELFIGAIIVVYFGILRALLCPGEDAAGGHYPALLAAGHRRQRLGRRVWHPGQHLRELAHGLRRPAGEAVPLLLHPAPRRNEHRDAAHLRRADHHAGDPALHPGELRGPCFIGFAIGESLGRRRSGSRAASSRRSPTSAPT